MGNSTRIHALIQNLSPNFQIDVFAYGNSLRYFKNVDRIDTVFEGPCLEYGIKNGKIDLWENIKKLKKNMTALFKSRKIIKQILIERRPCLILSDSCFAPVFLKQRPPLASINNANRIVRQAGQKTGCLASFIIEVMDFIWQSLVPDLVISPYFELGPDKKKFRSIPLIIRREFERAAIVSKPDKQGKDFSHSAHAPRRHRILVMTGGAKDLSHNLCLSWKCKDGDLFVLGRGIKISGRIQRVPESLNTASLIRQSTILVLNGGISSLAEALSCAKPMVVIPVPGSFEQKTNALWIQKNNMGIVSSWANMEKSILYCIRRHSFFKKNLLQYNQFDGATQAVDIISRSFFCK